MSFEDLDWIGDLGLETWTWTWIEDAAGTHLLAVEGLRSHVRLLEDATAVLYKGLGEASDILERVELRAARELQAPARAGKGKARIGRKTVCQVPEAAAWVDSPGGAAGARRPLQFVDAAAELPTRGERFSGAAFVVHGAVRKGCDMPSRRDVQGFCTCRCRRPRASPPGRSSWRQRCPPAVRPAHGNRMEYEKFRSPSSLCIWLGSV